MGNSFLELPKVYPSPTNGYSTLRVGNEFEGGHYTIRAIDGQIIEQDNIYDKLTEIDLTSVDNGVYIISVQLANQSYVCKMVKL